MGHGDDPLEALGQQLGALRGQTGNLQVHHQLTRVGLVPVRCDNGWQHAEQALRPRDAEQRDGSAAE